MPAIQSTPQNDFQNYNSNINNNFITNSIDNNNTNPLNYNNNNSMNDYPPSDLYGNADQRIPNNHHFNYGNDSNMGINMPGNYNNMNSNAFNKDNFTPQTRDRLRMAGNNIFK